MIKGFIGTSLVDYPGRISSVVFTYGCNFRCPFCYNIDLVLPERYKKLKNLPESWVIEEIKRRKGFIKGVVITGGEPTLWGKKLIRFVEEIRIETGLPVKLDTNGSQPELVKSLVEDRLIDFWAVDFKTSPARYFELEGDFRLVEETFKVLKEVADQVEIRITLYPPLLTEEDLEEMVPYLSWFKRIALQKFVPEHTLKQEALGPVNPSFYHKVAEFLRERLPEVSLIKRF
ncbi:anaerobic ribonucleoside-triphosphate reductase activating protein [Thermodesulfobacterium sp. TA1]|uniref:anaerobic ribonucleoside-triphosphate reductase activating protein n=1 Tax=Thermodesulfobacterium sp. TA1 TaxID=2234087 RepID=UPI0012322195|nr:anaerobic ribonucleoside-triphosphate reductase activating protein [Thermodesulfobacterium sp. TA1]QER42736.1 anaerobic ribonucleoside-triphosphate reductase activating protein [Thermodesulfobacterium sp. TA1]